MTIFAALLGLGIAGTGAAHAQPYYYGPRVYDAALPPYEIMRIVRSTGLAPLTRPTLRGATYVMVAANRSGGQMRVVVDARSGDILTVSPMVAMRPYGAPPLYPSERAGTAPPPDEPPVTYGGDPRFDGGVPPVPPRGVPNPRIATAPTAGPPAVAPPVMSVPPVTSLPPRDVSSPRVATAPAIAPPAASTPPARTPLPRPRPSVAANDTPAASPPAPVAPAAAASGLPTPVAPAIINPATQMVPVAPLE